MDISNLESLNTAFYVLDDWTRSLVFYLTTVFLVVSLRVLFLFRDQFSWITLGIRFCFGVLPLFACLVFIFGLASSTSGMTGGTWVSASEVIAGVLGIGTGVLLAYLAGRHFEPRLMEKLNRSTRPAGLQDRLSDIREVQQQHSDLPSIEHDEMFRQAAQREQIYLGQDVSGKAVTIDRKTWKTSHVQIMGPPGTGKGIQAGITLTQSIHCGDSVFVFDPKDDEWAPSVYHAACERAGVPFEFVDLRKSLPQINPILNASPEEVEEMLYAGLELGRRGNTADFYRLDDRKAARLAANYVSDSNLTLAEIGSKAKSTAGDELMTGGKAFFAALEEVSALKCVQTKEGVDLSERLKQGGCVYVLGSMRNEPIIVLQKMLFVRLIQLIERSRERGRHCTIFLDEFKYLLSQSALNALGSIRDKGCNILLAHQSLGDFANCGSDMSESSVRSTVIDTTPIKWLYRAADYETAKWISNQTGQILVATQSSQAVRNLELSESLSSTRSVGETTRNLIDVNSVLTLPKGCAVCIGAGVPKLALAEAVRVQKIEPRIKIADLALDEGVDLLTRVEVGDDEGRPHDWPSIDWHGDAKDAVLRYLFEETWTHIDIVRARFEQMSDEDVMMVLTELSEAKLIRNIEVSFLKNSKDEFWGITKPGVRMVQEVLGTEEPRRAFDKRTIKPISFNHHLDIQRIRVKAERCGWHSWRRMIGSEGFVGKGEKIPDAIAKRPDGARIAIEVERTIKSKSRYPGILASHLHARKYCKWDEIYYFCPDAQSKRRLERIFLEITEVKYFGNTVKMTDEHFRQFRLYSYDDDWA